MAQRTMSKAELRFSLYTMFHIFTHASVILSVPLDKRVFHIYFFSFSRKRNITLFRKSNDNLNPLFSESNFTAILHQIYSKCVAFNRNT